jgi:hypothetical protein
MIVTKGKVDMLEAGAPHFQKPARLFSPYWLILAHRVLQIEYNVAASLRQDGEVI